MTTITLEGKEYQLDIEQAEKLGLLKEKSTFKISTDYKTGAMVITE